MKILLLNASDVEGGAARAAYRLHQGLQTVGAASQMLVQAKHVDDGMVLSSQTKLANLLGRIRPNLDRLPLQFYANRNLTAFSSQWLPDAVASRVAQLCPDVINLHWICGGYLQIETVAKLNKPLVWTLHDMWAFTGGCHYSQECDRYTNSCGSCPQLHSSKQWDLSHWTWNRKANAWKNLNLTIVTPSAWLANCAQSSSLLKNFRIKVIPNGLDPKKYKPINRQVARELLNLPQDQQLVLFGSVSEASNLRKGFHLLQLALRKLSNSEWQDKIGLVIFGTSQSSNLSDLGFKSRYLGRLSDDISLALVYSAADVFIAPSTQDNLPNTIMEALACGTPCISFNIGGMPEMIEHQQNGYLAQPLDVEDLSQGIVWVLQDQERYQKLCDRAREKVEQEFSQNLQAHRYLSLFKEVTNT